MENITLNVQIEVPVKVDKNIKDLIKKYGQDKVKKALKNAIELKVFLQMSDPLEEAIVIDEDLYNSLLENLSYQENLGI
jgi:hypothetical protein